MTTPKRATAADRIAEIVRVARTLVAEEGAGALSMREVAKRIGITLTALQYHVPTKASLVELLTRDAVERYREALAPMVADDGQAPETRFARVVDWLLLPAEDWEEQVRFEVQLWAMAFTDAAAGRALDAWLARYCGFLSSLVSQLQPGLPPEQADARAAAIAAMLEGAILLLGPGRAGHAHAGLLRIEFARAALRIARGEPDGAAHTITAG